jgi:hypothetical protein
MNRSIGINRELSDGVASPKRRLLDAFQFNSLCKYILIVYRCAGGGELQEKAIETFLLLF